MTLTDTVNEIAIKVLLGQMTSQEAKEYLSARIDYYAACRTAGLDNQLALQGAKQYDEVRFAVISGAVASTEDLEKLLLFCDAMAKAKRPRRI